MSLDQFKKSRSELVTGPCKATRQRTSRAPISWKFFLQSAGGPRLPGWLTASLDYFLPCKAQTRKSRYHQMPRDVGHSQGQERPLMGRTPPPSQPLKGTEKPSLGLWI